VVHPADFIEEMLLKRAAPLTLITWAPLSRCPRTRRSCSSAFPGFRRTLIFVWSGLSASPLAAGSGSNIGERMRVASGDG
jgi:hypothetical protein